jgi:hypothetical protein
MLLTDLDKLIPPGTPPKVKTKLIASLLPTIEAVIARGFTHAQVHALLVDRGIVMKFKYYEDVIYQLRRKRDLVANVARAGDPNGAVLPSGVGDADPCQDKTERSSIARLQKGASLSGAIASQACDPNLSQRSPTYLPVKYDFAKSLSLNGEEQAFSITNEELLF